MTLYEYTASNGLAFEFAIINFSEGENFDFLAPVWEKRSKKQYLLLSCQIDSNDISDAVSEVIRRIEKNI